MNVRRALCAVALSSVSVIGVAAPASAVARPSVATTVSAVTRTATTLDCGGGSFSIHATYLLTARQVNVLKATVVFINTHPVLFGGTTCTVTP